MPTNAANNTNWANFLSDDIGARLLVFVQLWGWRPFPPHLPRVHPSPKMRCVQITLTLSNSDFSRSSLQMRQTSFSTRAAAALVTIIKIIEYSRSIKHQGLFKSDVGAWHLKNFEIGQKIRKTLESGCDGSTCFYCDRRHQYFISNQQLVAMAWHADDQWWSQVNAGDPAAGNSCDTWFDGGNRAQTQTEWCESIKYSPHQCWLSESEY